MLGDILQNIGVVFEDEKVILVKKSLKKGEEIPRHSHPGQRIFFTCVQGEIRVILNQEEEHIVKPGEVLTFMGDSSVEAVALEEAQAFVTLVK